MILFQELIYFKDISGDIYANQIYNFISFSGTKAERGLARVDYGEGLDNQYEGIGKSYEKVYEFPMLAGFLKKYRKTCRLFPFLPSPKKHP